MNKNQQKLVDYSYNLLARRRYSISEMVRKLEARNHQHQDLCTEAELAEILEALVRANLLNDRDFASFYIDSQLRRKPVGKLKIKMQLRKKGLDDSIIQQSLNLADLDDFTLATRLLEKKMRHYGDRELNDQKVQARLMRYLAGNGFNAEVSYRAFKELCRPGQSDLSDL
jgi:regulatory protein